MKKQNLNRLTLLAVIAAIAIAFISYGCSNSSGTEEASDTEPAKTVSAADILGNPAYRAISYGGYRTNTRDTQPTVAELKEDMLLLEALGVKVLRTYNVHLDQAANVLAAIRELKAEDPDFEMYVMLGAWINCKGAFTANPDHSVEDEAANSAEIERAVALAKQYPDIVKIIAVGNEAMVKWAASYFVQPGVILKWVNHLQGLKAEGELPADLWITSSDNFASWGGGGPEYHVEDLEKLLKAVDFVSLHTYPMHDTHYNPEFWGITEAEADLPKTEQIGAAMDRALQYAQQQYQQTKDYIRGLGVKAPIHIGETGWATASNSFYGPEGSKATDEYKSALYHERMRDWTDEAGISCFYFEAFDENWKDAGNPGGSENYFGLFTIDGKAKYAIWDLVDKGAFEGLGRNGQPVTKTYDGEKAALLETVAAPPMMAEEPAQ
ncbi:MAG: glycosyl hydrolase family 17 [Bacteroidetes bacterium]|jgi:exo-beta-1,3-glucanase (GH17 family)|nr:glycosyl hydrolase family 17 [Bacteroidota bacterium]